MSRPFYVTTPIYYPNDIPHIGHAYTTVAGDALTRWRRLWGDDVFYLTGVDEHGTNVVRAAVKQELGPQEFVDRNSPIFAEAWKLLDIANDDFIRTTEPRHYQAVQQFLQVVYDNGDIELGTYEGLYCVSCEAYYTEDELVDGMCPIHGRPVERMSEENYFFRLSAYAEPLLEHYTANPSAVQPEVRRNEVLSLIRGGLRDFSISRTSFDWGIPIPWDPKHVTYVWFDALTNYITAAGYGTDDAKFGTYWPALHLIGKDILRFHAIYWPAMLMAAGVEPPRQVFAHGFLTVGGQKMSKTNATGIHPYELIDIVGVDAYRYFFMREIQFGQDGSFSQEALEERYHADLANGLGNLASRVLAMLASNTEGAVPDANDPAEAGKLPALVDEVVARYDEAMERLSLTQALAAVWDVVGEANRYLVDRAPWALAKDPSRRGEMEAVLYASAEALRILAVLTLPIMPEAAAKLWSQLGMEDPLEVQRLPGSARWGGLKPGTQTRRGESLFPRLEA